MRRKDFLKKGVAGLTTIIALPVAVTSSTKEPADLENTCPVSPSETKGPFPNKTPAELVRANIISDRKGVPLLINLTVQTKSEGCAPLPGVFVDVWHCDSEGYYSEYGNHWMQSEDFTHAHFLRGRQTTNANGQVSFISIYPGWYPGRAPHVHVEIRDRNEKSLLVTQIAFPDEISDEVYQASDYQGKADTSNDADNLFADSLEGNMGVVSGNMTDGFTLSHRIVVPERKA